MSIQTGFVLKSWIVSSVNHRRILDDFLGEAGGAAGTRRVV